jgi:hypothetical protein
MARTVYLYFYFSNSIPIVPKLLRSRLTGETKQAFFRYARRDIRRQKGTINLI